MSEVKQIALVTGANKGIGKEIARQLAEAGVHVILGARDANKGRAAVSELAAAGLSVEFLLIDLDDEASIAAAADVIGHKHGRLDILVNNAAIASLDKDALPSKASVSVVRDIILTNFVGTFAVTQAMLPLLRKSASARIINASSPLGSMNVAGDPSSPYYQYAQIGYGASKAAVNMLTRQLNAEFAGSNIVANSVVPGFVKTDLTGGYGEMDTREGARNMVRHALIEDKSVVNRFVGPYGEVGW